MIDNNPIPQMPPPLSPEEKLHDVVKRFQINQKTAVEAILAYRDIANDMLYTHEEVVAKAKKDVRKELEAEYDNQRIKVYNLEVEISAKDEQIKKLTQDLNIEASEYRKLKVGYLTQMAKIDSQDKEIGDLRSQIDALGTALNAELFTASLKNKDLQEELTKIKLDLENERNITAHLENVLADEVNKHFNDIAEGKQQYDELNDRATQLLSQQDKEINKLKNQLASKETEVQTHISSIISLNKTVAELEASNAEKEESLKYAALELKRSVRLTELLETKLARKSSWNFFKILKRIFTYS